MKRSAQSLSTDLFDLFILAALRVSPDPPLLLARNQRLGMESLRTVFGRKGESTVTPLRLADVLLMEKVL